MKNEMVNGQWSIKKDSQTTKRLISQTTKKMELILERTELREDCTVGTLSVIKRVDDEYLAGETKDFLYDTLEPRVKELDAKGRYTITTPTAIPEGRYAVVITYCKEQDRWLPLLLWVPRFAESSCTHAFGSRCGAASVLLSVHTPRFQTGQSSDPSKASPPLAN